MGLYRFSFHPSTRWRWAAHTFSFSADGRWCHMEFKEMSLSGKAIAIEKKKRKNKGMHFSHRARRWRRRGRKKKKSRKRSVAYAVLWRLFFFFLGTLHRPNGDNVCFLIRTQNCAKSNNVDDKGERSANGAFFVVARAQTDGVRKKKARTVFRLVHHGSPT